MGFGLHEIWKQKIGGLSHWLRFGLDDAVWRLVMNRKLRKRLAKGQEKRPAHEQQDVLAFWKPYRVRFNAKWHAYYANCTGVHDPRYLPDDLYYTVIDRYLNDPLVGLGLSDKNNLPLLFPAVDHPKAILRKVKGNYFTEDYQAISEEEAFKRLNGHKQLVIKPSLVSHSGQGVIFWTKGQETTAQDWVKKHGLNLVVQEPLLQHSDLAALHPESVNTVRMMTLLKDGKGYHLSSILRMGIAGSRVDNAGAGGITCGIQADGSLKDVGFDLQGNRFKEHPQGGPFTGHKVPAFEQMVETAIKLQERMGHFRMVSWDFTVNNSDQLILVEANFWSGGLSVHQFCNGPLLGNYTEAVLEEVFGRA